METPPPMRVLYNDTCPICAREIGIYAREADETIEFCPLDQAARFGLSQDAAAKQLHVARGGQVLAGMDAFIALWAALPRWRWLGRLAALPLAYGLLARLYRHIAAPLLYHLHLRRQRR
jgi:predicted DCC family thiol-disulfide oxidoreductase YuxK